MVLERDWSVNQVEHFALATLNHNGVIKCAFITSRNQLSILSEHHFITRHKIANQANVIRYIETLTSFEDADGVLRLR